MSDLLQDDKATLGRRRGNCRFHGHWFCSNGRPHSRYGGAIHRRRLSLKPTPESRSTLPDKCCVSNKQQKLPGWALRLHRRATRLSRIDNAPNPYAARQPQDVRERLMLFDPYQDRRARAAVRALVRLFRPMAGRVGRPGLSQPKSQS